jgi:sulfite dehydrogenase (cytochrome) subunit B
MKRSILLPFAALAVSTLGLGVAAVSAKPVTYELPDETAAFKPGPNLETVQGNCGACHSADYILTQPQGPAFKKAFWEAEVTKMIKVYGAPIDEADVPKIVDYLTQTY